MTLDRSMSLWIFVVLSIGATVAEFHDGRETSKDFTNEWVVQVIGGPEVADLVAQEIGFDNQGEIMGFPDHYLMVKEDHPSLDRSEAFDHTMDLQQHSRVLNAQQLFHKIRVKRRPPEQTFEALRESMIARMLLEEPLTLHEDDRGIPPELLALWDEENNYEKEKAPIQTKRLFNDLLWDHQWYMQDTRRSSDLPDINLHTLPLYERGITGKGVRVCVLDDGLEHQHDDLKNNYDPSISYDFNDMDDDPTPHYPDPASGGAPNSHGTRCAGEIAMEANNEACGVGIAYNAKIGGIRMLAGKISDKIEAWSLQHAIDKVDIFTASWGPSDNGKTVEGPGYLTQMALENGTKKGRNGKGIVYVWAAGNGGMHEDDCNCDGYTGSIYTISIGSASEQGLFPWYGEKCSSTMASAFSSGAYTDQKIATTDNNNTCTVSHTGTSAAAPLAAGIIALALEANPSLTWRDVQHLIVYTAAYETLRKNQGWRENAAGFRYNPRFGFGVIHGERFVNASLEWKNVPKTFVAEKRGKPSADSILQPNDDVIVPFNVSSDDSGGIVFLEHVQVTVNIDYPVRGVIEVVLQSPGGTLSQLLSVRKEDDSSVGFKDWTFMSVHFWGENPVGDWIVHVLDRTTDPTEETHIGSVGEMKLTFHGMKVVPDYSRKPKLYNYPIGNQERSILYR